MSPCPEPRSFSSRRIAIGTAAIYVLVAGAWIYFSDALLGGVLSSPENITLAQMYKGGGFVLVTGLLLYVFLRASLRLAFQKGEAEGVARLQARETGESPAPQVQGFFLPWLLFGASSVVVFALGMMGQSWLDQRMILNQERNLDAIAQLKAREIAAWREERFDDLRSLTGNRRVADDLALVIEGRSTPFLRDSIVARLEAMLQAYGYTNIYLVNAEGQVQLSVGLPEPLGGIAQALARHAMQDREIHQSGIHDTGDVNWPHMDIAGPVTGSQGVAGALVLRVDPSRQLFPIMHRWADQGETGEILLLELHPELNGVVRVNRPRLAPWVKELSFIAPDALTDDMPMAQALHGKEGVVTGRDYRQVAVLASVRRVPGSDWVVVAKIDREEVQAPIREAGLLVILVTLALLLVMVSLIWFWVRAQGARHQRQLWQAIQERRALVEHYDYLSRYANDVILLLDEHGQIVEANDRAEQVYGRAREALIGMSFLELHAPAALGMAYRDTPLYRAGSALFETRHRRADGVEFPVEVSARRIDVQGRTFVQEIVRDISERKQSEARILRLNKLYAMLSATNQMIVRVPRREELLHEICRILVESGLIGGASVLIEETSEAGGRQLVEVAEPGREPPGGRLKRAGQLGALMERVRTAGALICNGAASEASRCTSCRLEGHALAVLPLRLGERLLGLLMVESSAAAFFDEDLVNLLREQSRDLSFGLENLQREQARAQALAAEAQARQRLEMVMSVSPAVIYAIELETVKRPFRGRLAFLSASFEALTGLESTDLYEGEVFERWSRHLHPDDREKAQNAGESLEQGGRLLLQYRVRHADGHYLYVQDSSMLVQGEGARKPLLVGAWLDISALKRVEEALRAEEARYHQLFDITPLPMWVVDRATQRFLDVNLAALTHYGYPREDFLALDMTQLNAGSPRVIDESAMGHAPYLGCHRTADGREIDVQVFSHPFEYEGRAARLVLAQDVTERLRAEAQQRLAATVFEGAAEAIAVCDAAYRVLTVNDTFTRLTGYPLIEVKDKDARFLDNEGANPPDTLDNLWSSLDTLGHWAGELNFRRKSGEVFPVWLGMSAVRDADRRLSHYILMFSDLSEQRAAQEAIHFLSYHDSLTGLPNRSLLRDRLEQALQASVQHGTQGALLYLDLDRFKNINDSLGHEVGDKLIEKVARRLQDSLGAQATLSRQGGDEFFVLLTESGDAAQVARYAQTLLDRIAEPFDIDGQTISTSLSIGITLYPDDAGDSETLLKQADAALFYAKAAGRNVFRFFTDDMNIDARERLELENSLRRAIENNELSLHYQPQYALADGHMVGAEALLRWQHPRLGAVQPMRFIPIAEDSGLIVSIGAWVLREACAQMRRWLDAGLDMPCVAVNLSALQFRREGLEALVEETLRETGIPAGRLELELTESILMQDTDNTLQTVQSLKALGVRLSIDDFGTGYSSLSYLRRFAVDKLKIDQSFVREAVRSPDAAAIVHAVVQLARGLGLRTIAEGVEMRAHVEYLLREGCDEVQGFYFGRPMPQAELTRLLREGHRAEVPSLPDAPPSEPV